MRPVSRWLIFLLILIFPAVHAYPWKIMYKEEYYKLYHEQLHHYPDDTMEVMFYLEQALTADFANPLNALAKINNPTDWERYRNLFMMHVDLALVHLSLTLASKYDKRVAYFYNAPWKEQNIDSLNTAEIIYKSALGYWTDAKKWSDQAWTLRDVHLDQIQDWEDENMRIETGDLDYARIVQIQLDRVARVRAEFQAMNQTTY